MRIKRFPVFFITILLASSCNQVKHYDSQLYFHSISNVYIPFSGDIDSKENKDLIANLELMGKLWGFLKYHHPAVGKGNWDWDHELFWILPEYLKVDGTAERDELLIQWIEKYGEIPKCTTCKETPPDAFLKPDLSWVEQFGMSAVLKEKIREVYRNRHQGDQYYVSQPSLINIANEEPYSNMPSFDSGLQLLSLYRYWNMIQYFFPYKYLTDKEWSDVLKEYIPKFAGAKTALEYQLAVLQLTGEISDTHGAYIQGFDRIDSLRGNWFSRLDIRFIENQWVVATHSPFGLQRGDIITHINGKKIESIVDSIKIFYNASNEATRMRVLQRDLLRSTEKTISIDFISSMGASKHTNLALKQVFRSYWPISGFTNSGDPKAIEVYPQTEGDIGYINSAYLKEREIVQIKQLFSTCKGIIIDLRYGAKPGIFDPLYPYLVSETRPYVKFTLGNINNPGEFAFYAPNYYIKKSKEADTYKGKLVVLVNEVVQSSGETATMAFRAGDNTTIIGSQTAGTNGDVLRFVLPGGLKMYFSGIGVYYPDGRETQRVGIVPDIEVKPTIKGIREGRDELLEKAIEIIKQK